MGRSYRDLIAWQKSMDLVEKIYECTKAFPREEIYGLTAQLRRAAVSIPSNIAEGQARHSQPEFKHFLTHARGSLVEVETQIQIANRLKYLSTAAAQAILDQCAELGRILNALIAAIKLRTEN
jgi:four helix bundle protein